MLSKPKLPTPKQLAYDLEITLEQLRSELYKHNPDMKVAKQLIQSAITRAISVVGIIQMNLGDEYGNEEEEKVN